MTQRWLTPILIIVSLFTILIPRVRRMIFFQILKSRLFRNIGLKLFVLTPYFREKMLSKILPTRQA